MIAPIAAQWQALPAERLRFNLILEGGHRCHALAHA